MSKTLVTEEVSSGPVWENWGSKTARPMLTHRTGLALPTDFDGKEA